jgi:hypothetical protein
VFWGFFEVSSRLGVGRGFFFVPVRNFCRLFRFSV